MPLRRLRLLGALPTLAGALVLVFAAGCFSKRVTRIEPTAVTDLSGRWNDTDSRLVANQLVEQTLGAGWAKRYTDTHGGEAPTVIVGTFANRTMEHIAVGAFVKDIEKALITTGAGDHFNSGFCLGKLLGFDNATSVLCGVSTSGHYVRSAQSPSIEDLAAIFVDIPKHQLV